MEWKHLHSRNSGRRVDMNCEYSHFSRRMTKEGPTRGASGMSPDQRLYPTAWHKEDQRFLEGPRWLVDESLRVIRIVREFVRGFWALSHLGPCVTVFGSARFEEDHQYYRMARQVGREIALQGFTVLTGGGPGIMEAANRGARDVKGRSVGCNITLPHEQAPNPYLDQIVTFRYFFVRKVMLVKYSQAFVIFPGGFGTMDEAFEAATLVQTEKILDFPIVFVGTEYWQPLFDFLNNQMIPEGTIDLDDYERFVFTDSIDEVLACLDRCPSCPGRQRAGRIETRRWLMREWGTAGHDSPPPSQHAS